MGTSNGSGNGNSYGFISEYREPAVVLIVADSGTGKTSDCLFSFPCGFFIAGPGQLKPSIGLVGYTPQNDEGRIKHIDELTALLPLIAGGKPFRFSDGFTVTPPAGGFDALVVDDFSYLAKRTSQALAMQYARSDNRFASWLALSTALLKFRDTARNCGIHVVMNGHPHPPDVEDGVQLRGTIDLPGKQAMREFPPVCDIVLRMVPEPTRQYGWKAVYRCSVEDTLWYTKDRTNSTRDKSPANLREILRSAGYKVRRAPGLEWMDDVVDALVADTIDNGEHQRLETLLRESVFRWIQEKYLSKLDCSFVRKILAWVERDAHDRLTMKLLQQDDFRRYGIAQAPQQPLPAVVGR